jgi:hypothetical protein
MVTGMGLEEFQVGMSAAGGMGNSMECPKLLDFWRIAMI